MPTYDYSCHSCANKFEELVMGKETITCPRCGTDDVQKELSGFAVGIGGRIPSDIVDAARLSAGGGTEQDKPVP